LGSVVVGPIFAESLAEVCIPLLSLKQAESTLEEISCVIRIKIDASSVSAGLCVLKEQHVDVAIAFGKRCLDVSSIAEDIQYLIDPTVDQGIFFVPR